MVGQEGVFLRAFAIENDSQIARWDHAKDILLGCRKTPVSVDGQNATPQRRAGFHIQYMREVHSLPKCDAPPCKKALFHLRNVGTRSILLDRWRALRICFPYLALQHTCYGTKSRRTIYIARTSKMTSWTPYFANKSALWLRRIFRFRQDWRNAHHTWPFRSTELWTIAACCAVCSLVSAHIRPPILIFFNSHQTHNMRKSLPTNADEDS